MHPRAAIIAPCLLASLATAQTIVPPVEPQPAKAPVEQHQLKLSLDPLLDIAKVWSLKIDDIEKQFSDPGFKENPFLHWSDANHIAEFSDHPYSNISVELTLLAGAVPLSEASLFLDPTDQTPSKLSFTTTRGGRSALDTLRAKLSQLLGTEAHAGPRPALGWKSEANAKSDAWTSSKATAVLTDSDTGVKLYIGKPGTDPTTLLAGTAEASRARHEGPLEFFVRLDELLPVPALWTLKPADLDERLSSKGLGMKENPFFKWSTAAHDSARFSKDLFSNTKTDVLLFNGTVNAEEVNIDFINGRASRLVVTLLTRGNNKDKVLTSEDFDRVYKSTGRALGTMLGVRPSHTTPSGKTLSKADGYLWTTPHTLALLEFNAEAPQGKVEFLRLTMMPGNARAQILNLAGIGNNATTRSRDSLSKSVKRDKNSGDVEITGVPMRDQGQKGYCVAASCERLFRYLGQPCDMDELAQLVSADADRGASPSVMYSSLAKIDQRYNVRVKLLKIPPRYGLGDALKSKTELEHAQKANMQKIVQDNIDAGLPLLWCVLLNPGDTGVSPQPGQPRMPTFDSGARVGHMRLIIGYNPKTRSLIYTDSWGAGHERKIMSMGDAELMTTAVFSMTPSR